MTEILSLEQIEADKSLCNSALPGPWLVGVGHDGRPFYEILEHTHETVVFANRVYAKDGPHDDDGYNISEEHAGVSPRRVATAKLLTRARTAIPLYIKALVAARLKIAELEALINQDGGYKSHFSNRRTESD